MHKPDGSSNQERGWRGEQSPLQAQNLKRILGDGPSLDVVFIYHADPLQEMDGVGVAQVPLKHLEYVSLHQETSSLVYDV